MNPLIFLALFFILGTCPNAQGSYLFVFDLDRVLISSEAELPNGFAEGDNIIRAAAQDYQVASYTHELLWFLRHSLARNLGENVELAVFSAGAPERNIETAVQLGIVAADQTKRLVKNFSSLFHLELQEKVGNIEERTLRELQESIARKGGQEKMPFFTVFTKDLSVFNHDQQKIIIIEDNFNAVPSNQQANLVLAARWDVDEDFINLRDRSSTIHWQSDPASPVQIFRSEQRLVRVAGLLKIAADDFKKGIAPSLPEALFRLQWTGRGRFRSKYVNHPSVTLEGLRVLRKAQKEILKTKLIKAADNPITCESHF